MNIVGAIATILNSLLLLFVIVLLVRLVLDWVPFFNREWRPKGAGLVAAEIVYTVTDPPIKLVRRFVPPLRLGAVMLDTSFLIVLIVVYLLRILISNIFFV